MNLERIIVLVLAAIMLVFGGIGAYYFILETPDMGPRTPAEKMIAEKWIRVFLTILWVGFGAVSVALLIVMSTVIGKTTDILKKRKLSSK